jgi:hypothetical protein
VTVADSDRCLAYTADCPGARRKSCRRIDDWGITCDACEDPMKAEAEGGRDTWAGEAEVEVAQDRAETGGLAVGCPQMSLTAACDQ